jgi:hypothetical protein
MGKRKTYKKTNLQRTLKAMAIGEGIDVLGQTVIRLTVTAWEIFGPSFGARYGRSPRQIAKAAGLTPQEYREMRAATHKSMYATFPELRKYRPNAKTLKETTSALTYRTSSNV